MSDIERFEERTPDGRLASVGVAWSECREGVRGLVFGLMFLSTIIGTFTALLGAAMAKSWWLPVGIGLALLIPIFFFDRISIAGRPRRLMFYRDGRIEAPLGFEAYAAKYKSVSGHNADVVSIEARQTASPLEAELTPYSHGVVIYMRNGDVAYVAGRLALPLMAVPGFKLESGRDRPAAVLAVAQRRPGQTLAARSFQEQVGGSRARSAA